MQPNFVSSDLPFTPKELLEFWQITWFPLDEKQQQKFLITEETHLLCKWPRSKVKKFLQVEQKLRIALREVRVEEQQIAKFEKDKKLEESFVAAKVKGLVYTDPKQVKSWCGICSCNHLPNSHHDRESYL